MADLVFDRPKYTGGPVDLVFGGSPTPTPTVVSLKVWSGSVWIAGDLKRWDGARWIDVAKNQLNRWEGSAWVQAQP